MSATTKSQIFDAFFSTKKTAGFGLGLATAHEFVHNLGGSIDVDSTVDVGSTFIVRLPTSTSRSKWRTVSTIRNKADEVPCVGHAGHVLVVDDEDMVRRSTRRILAVAGLEVSEATCGAEALTRYAHGHPRPDVVLLDLSMPDGSGDDVLARLLEIDPGACVVIVTGHQDPAREDALSAAGAQGIVHKPWEPGELLQLIDQLLTDVAAPERPTRA
jgi:two-component system cell cycle sensor histidine kinase/response regulator CckA